MPVKEYNIEFGPMLWQCNVQIDEEFHLTNYKNEPATTKDAIKEMVMFWPDWYDRVEDNNNDFTQTFLKQLGKKIFRVACANNVNVKGIVKSFEGAEGWCPMDGSFGITIVSIDTFTFSDEDFFISENTHA